MKHINGIAVSESGAKFFPLLKEVTYKRQGTGKCRILLRYKVSKISGPIC